MTEMYGSYSDEDLNEWERMPQNIRVLTSSAFGAWLLRRDKNKKEQEPKTGHWIVVPGMNEQCSKCGKFFPLSYFKGRPFEINYCPNCGAKMEG